MPIQNASQTKEKILSILRTRGPSLPVHIANQVNMSILFSSAFLAELLSEKKIKISHMRVGTSPIYLIPGQESRLETFSQHIKGKEKEALQLLQQKKFLKDSVQQPAIRVALRSIRDFAIPFKPSNSEDIFWRYFTISQDEFKAPNQIKPQSKSLQPIPPQEIPKQEIVTSPPKELDIFDSQKQEQISKEKPTKRKKSKPKTQDNKFFNKVKEHLDKNQIKLVDILEFSKTKIILKTDYKTRTHLLVAYNKKRINEYDIINSYKKAQEYNLPFLILSLGEPLKKLTNLLDATKALTDIKKIQ